MELESLLNVSGSETRTAFSWLKRSTGSLAPLLLVTEITRRPLCSSKTAAEISYSAVNFTCATARRWCLAGVRSALMT